MFGWKEASRQNTSGYPVINWIPGDSKDLPAQNIGLSPRNIADLEESFEIRIRAHDSTDTSDSLKQYKITRLLYDVVRASLYRASHGTTWIDSVKWHDNIGPEKRLGSMLILSCRIRCPVPDLELGNGAETYVSALINQSVNNSAISYTVDGYA